MLITAIIKSEWAFKIFNENSIYLKIKNIILNKSIQDENYSIDKKLLLKSIEIVEAGIKYK